MKPPTLTYDLGLSLPHQLVAVAAKQIATSVAARGETTYSLERGGQIDERRTGAIRRYLAKLVASRATKARAEGGE